MAKHKDTRKKPPDVVEATAAYDKWLASHLQIIRNDLALKHEFMAAAVFPFFRATFYRWAQLWPVVCKDLSKAPHVLAVGDLHVENFGTWRDIEGRLIWGINDFDEAWPAAYTVDLVRLATSAYLAIDAEHLSVTRRHASSAIEDGYRDGMKKGGAPFVLAEQHRWLRVVALNELRDPIHFWDKIESLLGCKSLPPKKVLKLAYSSLPLQRSTYETKRRVAGLGSLGHPRLLVLASWHGSHVIREAKQLRPSAWVWAAGKKNGKILSEKLIAESVRVADPHVHFLRSWEVRRLAPDCSRIELDTLPEEHDEEKLLYAMGFETANIHLGSPGAIPSVKRDLAKRHGKWLHKAAKNMCKVTIEDWKDWRHGRKTEDRKTRQLAKSHARPHHPGSTSER
jgi:hypothetical protein